MLDAIWATKGHFVSSCARTPEYLEWHRVFKRDFTKFLKSHDDITEVVIGKPNHFDMSGFFRRGEQWWYFSISDLRWSKESMLIRTAKDTKDWTGGMNQFASLEGVGQFTADFDRIVR